MSGRRSCRISTGAAPAAKYALLAGAELDAEQAYAWQRITAIVDRLKAARRILI